MTSPIAPPSDAVADSHRPESHATDRWFAVLTVLFAVLVGCVLLYGRWWRRERMSDSYLNRLAQVRLDYQRMIESPEGHYDEIFHLGSQAHLLMKRLRRAPDDFDWQWQRSEFLRQQANQLEHLTRVPDAWANPDLLARARDRLHTYHAESRSLRAKVQASQSPLRHAALLRSIEDSLVHAMPGREQAEQHLASLSSLLSAKTDSVSPQDEDTQEGMSPSPSDGLHRRAIILSAWMWLDSAWQDSLPGTPLIATKSAVAAAIEGLRDLRQFVESMEHDELTEPGVQDEGLAMIDMAMQMLALQNTDPSQNLASSSNPMADQAFTSWNPNESSHPSDGLPLMLARCLQADSAALRRSIAELQQGHSLKHSQRHSPKYFLGASETAFLQRSVARLICRLIASPHLTSLPSNAATAMAQGFDLAMTLDSGSPECCAILHTMALLRSDQPIVPPGPEMVQRLSAVTEETLASPGQPAFLVTALLASGMDDDQDQIVEWIETGTMLHTQLPMRIALVAMWRFGATETGALNREPSALNPDELNFAGEAESWCRTLEAIMGGSTERIEEPSGTSASYSALALAAWQIRAGRTEAAAANLETAHPNLGQTPIFAKIERIHARRSARSQ